MRLVRAEEFKLSEGICGLKLNLSLFLVRHLVHSHTFKIFPVKYLINNDGMSPTYVSLIHKIPCNACYCNLNIFNKTM